MNRTTTSSGDIKKGEWSGAVCYGVEPPLAFRYRFQDGAYPYRAETYDGQNWFEALTEDDACFGLIHMIYAPKGPVLRKGLDAVDPAVATPAISGATRDA